jgi:DNA-binding transcriptional ArsR family regulator
VLAACTPTIDTHHAVMASMGERFLLYRLPKPSGQDLVKRALAHTGQETAMRQELAQAVAGLFAAVQLPTDPSQRSADDEARLIALASLAARCRSAVERNGYTRAIELIPDPEVPARLALTLLRLLVGMRSLGVPEAEQWAVLIKVAQDCIPALRLRIVELLGAFQVSMKTSEIAVRVRYPSQTVRRALEDLTAHGIVIRQGVCSGYV